MMQKLYIIIKWFRSEINFGWPGDFLRKGRSGVPNENPISVRDEAQEDRLVRQEIGKGVGVKRFKKLLPCVEQKWFEFAGWQNATSVAGAEAFNPREVAFHSPYNLTDIDLGRIKRQGQSSCLAFDAAHKLLRHEILHHLHQVIL
jgi:hypothetical protein